MSFRVKTIPEFEKQLKKLANKYPSIKGEYIDLVKSLEENPKQGTPLLKNCYKIRIAIKSKGKGRSGGGRVITHFAVFDETVFLLTIYYKSEQESITDALIKSFLKNIEK